MDNLCCIKGCDNTVLAMGLCINHWRANKKHGSPVVEKRLSAANRGLSDQERFWKSVTKSEEPNGCWVWSASRDRDGYGSFYAVIGGIKTTKAHRYSHMLSTGEALGSHIVVMHSCDNPACVRPDHLSSGTPLENTRDMMRKCRDTMGRKAHSEKIRKLSEDQIRSILRDRRRYPDIAAEYGIHPQSVLSIKARSTRSEVTIDPSEIVRSSRGSKGSNRSKSLTDDDVRFIRQSTEGPTALSRKYSVSPQTICDIQKRRSWKHI